LSPAEESWRLGGSDQSRRTGARGGGITQHEGPEMFASQQDRNLKSTLLKCSETSQYENANTDHRHGTKELGRIAGAREDASPGSPRMRGCCRPQARSGGRGRERSRQRFSEGPGSAHHSLCLGDVRNWSAGAPVLPPALWEGRGSGLSGGARGPKAGVSPFPHPAPRLEFLHS